MSIDDYNLYGYLMMCIDAYNLREMSINGYGLYCSFLKKWYENGIKMGLMVMG